MFCNRYVGILTFSDHELHICAILIRSNRLFLLMYMCAKNMLATDMDTILLAKVHA